MRVAVGVGSDGRLQARSAGAQNAHLLLPGARTSGLALLPDGEGALAGDEVEVLVLAWDQVEAGSVGPAG